MPNYTVSSGVFSSQSLNPNDTMVVQLSGVEGLAFFQDATITVNNGGSAFLNTITDYSTETLDGIDQRSIVANGGEVLVQSDGAAGSLLVEAGGFVNVAGNGLAPNTSSGVASNTSVQAGGQIQVSQDGLALGTNLFDGQQVIFDGFASNTVISLGGLELVEDQGVASATFVNSGGVEQAVSGGESLSATVSFGGSAVAESFGTLSGATISSGGSASSASAAKANGTTIEAGGLDVVSSNGFSDNGIVFGEQIVSGGSVSISLIETGGLQILSGGGAADTDVDSGAEQLALSSAFAIFTQVLSGGSAVAESRRRVVRDDG